MNQRIGCYNRHYLDWEAQHKCILFACDAWEVPADALLTAITQQGFQVTRFRLGRGRLAEVNWDTAEVRVDIDFEQRLGNKQRALEAMHSTLCHELAHIVLHPGKRPQRHHETQAWVWATMFLAPWHLVSKRRELRALDGDLSEKQRWQAIYEMADWLKISPTLMKGALDLYQIGASFNHGRAA